MSQTQTRRCNRLLNMAASAPSMPLITVSDFLRERRIPEEVISRLEEEKIDKDVIPLMEDGDLAKYFSSYVDRLALMNFCKNQTPLQKQKMGLFEKLQAKLRLRTEVDAKKNEDQVPNIESPTIAKKRGRASQRKIEIGWLYCEYGQVKQMRTKQGGGTRTVVVGVECSMDTVLEKGNNFFFPKGMSTKGNQTDFNFEVWDYKHNPVCEDVTVGLIYDTLCMARLRFYIATSPKKDLQNDRATDDTEAEGVGNVGDK